jgi:hypothetical protein
MARLAEAKGAVELLLARPMRGATMWRWSPFAARGRNWCCRPRARWCRPNGGWPGLPGGGGTPLAAGLQAALEAAAAGRAARGMTPTLALLTDGRANIALDGRANRPQAMADALAAWRGLAAAPGCPAVVIDTGIRPTPALAGSGPGDGRALAGAAARRCSGGWPRPVGQHGRTLAMSGDQIPDDWPHRAAIDRLRAPHHWHVQVRGQGPDVLLLHGAGASAHFRRALAAMLDGYR